MDGFPPATREYLVTSMRLVHENIVVKRCKFEFDARTRQFQQLFHGTKEEDDMVFKLLAGPKMMRLHGEQRIVAFTQAQRTLQFTQKHGGASSKEVRASILHQQSPIHSYLFDKQGKLLIANHKAAGKWRAKGMQDKEDINLINVLETDGQGSAEAASAALIAIYSKTSSPHTG
ncbi:hypothetical protein WJX74_005802 [Apatococcus lobatus]|uniref:Uncharacterized protein n=1 Tax=Apatococcus lobatus TaxID=904363 RepID=A0AAW1RZ10_9CHLO